MSGNLLAELETKEVKLRDMKKEFAHVKRFVNFLKLWFTCFCFVLTELFKVIYWLSFGGKVRYFAAVPNIKF